MLEFSIHSYHDIEVYFFKLSIFTDSDEYLELSQKKRTRIDKEILSIDNTLGVMAQFVNFPKRERGVVATNIKTGRVCKFSSFAVAKRVCKVHNIQRYCTGERKQTGDYKYEFQEDYIETVSNEPKWYDHY